MNYHYWNYTISEPGVMGFGKTVMNNLLLGYGGALVLLALFVILMISFWYKTREIIGSAGLASIIIFVVSVGMLTLGLVNDITVWTSGIIAAILAFISAITPKD